MNFTKPHSQLKINTDKSPNLKYAVLGTKSILTIFTLIMFFSLLTLEVAAFPPIAAEFYGEVRVGDVFAPPGTIIAIYTAEGVRCGSFELVSSGKYGFLSCKGDDLSSEEIEGAKPGEELWFYVNGRKATSLSNIVNGPVTWSEASFKEINLTLKTEIQDNGGLSLGLTNQLATSAKNEQIDSLDNIERNAPGYPHQRPWSKTDILLSLIILLSISVGVTFGPNYLRLIHNQGHESNVHSRFRDFDIDRQISDKTASNRKDKSK
jgi:hypothetical protein